MHIVLDIMLTTTQQDLWVVDVGLKYGVKLFVLHMWLLSVVGTCK